nr:hypothetical protein [Tanacetum cinerariifolium]
MEKFLQIFHDLHFDISFADALFLMPKFSSTIKSLLANKDKLFELAKVPLTENSSVMLLKSFQKSLEIREQALISCPYRFGKKLSLLELTPTRMTLKLADRSITHPKGVDEDVFVKVMYMERKLPSGVDIIDIACEDFVQDILDFQYNPKISSPTLVYDDLISESDACKEPIVKSSLPTLTSFGEGDFFLEEIEIFLNDDLIPTGIENSVYDPEGGILFLKKLLNEDPFKPPPMDLKLAEESKEKSSVEEPPELELKELPSYLEEALINVLKSHKRAIAWKISDIKGIDSKFCTHKILMEDDYKPAVQSQRRVNPKIHDVIKKEVIKLLDA